MNKPMIPILVAAAALAIESAPKAARVPEEMRLQPGFAKTAQMRDEVGREVNWGTEGAQMGERVFTNNVAELARIFRNDEGAVMCQGAAYYLHLKYLDAGYRSYLVGFQSDMLSHSMVLVEIVRADGTRALVVQDPSFNLSYVDRSGQALSIFEIMSKLSQGNDESIIIKEGRPADVNFLRDPADQDLMSGAMKSPYVKEFVGPSEANPTWLKYRGTMSLAIFTGLLRDQVDVYCSARGVAKSILYAVFDQPIYVYRRYPMSSEDKKDADKVLRQLENHYAGLRKAKQR